MRPNFTPCSTAAFCLLVIFCLSTGYAGAAERFGLIYDLQGQPRLTTSEGKKSVLARERDLLRTVHQGDELQLPAGSKLLIVSLKDGSGYELQPLSRVIIGQSGISVKEGKPPLRRSYKVAAPPSAPAAAASAGALVIRGSLPPVKLIAPVGYTVLEPTPILKWEQEGTGMDITVSRPDYTVVFTSENVSSPFKVPEGKLAAGEQYFWTVTTPYGAVSTGRFTIASDDVRKQALELKKLVAAQPTDVAARFSLLSFLRLQNINDDAELELRKLQAEFPDNANLRNSPASQ